METWLDRGADALVVVAVVVWLALIGRLVTRQNAETLPIHLPDAAAREKAAEALWETYPAFPDEPPETALFLLEEAKRSYDSWIETNGRLEGKATALLSTLAGGTGLLTILASLHSGKIEVRLGPFLALAALAAFVSLLSCLYLLRPKVRPHPSVADYVAPAIAFSPFSRFHLALALADDYNRAGLVIARTRRFDPVAWTSAQAALVVAAVGLTVHFGLGLASTPSVPTVVQCQEQIGPNRSGTAVKITCQER